ncbi:MULTISPECIES: hypothetical protein [Cyanophyceae]|uniref:Nucleotidyl transferase AbiEii toxin, Type IV TA system n=1 Tax=Leptolyngbya subtilissima DQ-A4 TaxID=2933933 RepID=A0ABV0KA73_9CYAN|nr:hypothetical protein [Nodosilinea sp. FACHB-141]MBD2115175.1 hypothetical protein [Nodosilinea sp. FACHB-141]
MNNNFLEAVRSSQNFLRELCISERSAFIFSGGAVHLYQLSIGCLADRIPTDLDIIFQGFENTDSILRSALSIGKSHFSQLTVKLEDRWHQSFFLKGPIIEAETINNFPVDFVPGAMATHFPRNHNTFPNHCYIYPVFKDTLFQLSRNTSIPGFGDVQLAHPAFIAFYKLNLMRSRDGKQDALDIRRLIEMGLVHSKCEETLQVFQFLSYGNLRIANSLIKMLRDIELSLYEQRRSMPGERDCILSPGIERIRL